MRVTIRTPEDLVALRVALRDRLRARGFGLAAQTKLVAAVGAIARNAVEHAGGGEVEVEDLRAGSDRGVVVAVRDSGPGIADIKSAMQDGFSTGTGSGFGMSGAARLVDAFQVESDEGRGTWVTLTMWRREREETGSQ